MEGGESIFGGAWAVCGAPRGAAGGSIQVVDGVGERRSGGAAEERKSSRSR